MLKGRIYEQSKGRHNQSSYIIVTKKSSIGQFKLNDVQPALIKIKDATFPAVLKTTKDVRFTVPIHLANNIKTPQNIYFNIISIPKERNSVKKEGYANLLNIIPRETIRGYPLHKFELENNRLLLWIYSKGNNAFELPKLIPIRKGNYSLLELFGAYFCEGFKSRKKGKHLDRFSFSNADGSQIAWFVKAAESILGIKKDLWKVQILFPEKDQNTIRNLEEYWSEFGLLKDNIKIIKNSRVSASHGVCILNIHNSTLAEVFYYIMEYCMNLTLSSKQFSIETFRGLSRGDIGVSHKEVNFSTESRENALFFKNICKIIGIRTSKMYYITGKKGYWSVRITNRSNFIKLLKLGCITHQKRKNKLVRNIFNNKKVYLYKYLDSVNNGFNTSLGSAKFLRLSQITTRMFLTRLEEENYLKAKIDKNHYRQKIYSFTNKGKEELDFYKSLKRV
ncbi:MAG: hypothetical protein ABIJ92_02265 [Candidatus Aenigmatarchaeota archaeon]